MTELVPDVSTPSDAELISRVRGGDTAAYGALFDRHREAANRLARQLQRGPDSDDLVSEAFIKVLQVLQSGGGPDVAFRAYLLTAVRRLHVDRVRSARRMQPTDEVEQLDAGVPFQDTAVDGFERSVTARAFASLPERWQLVLWHLEVEGNKPADVAPMLGMSPNSVSALAYRAREGLRQAYLQMHLTDTAGDGCRWTTEHLGAYVRGGLARRDATKVDRHLEECRRCTGIYLELTEVNSNLRGLLAPLLLGTIAPGYLAATSAATGAGTAFGLGALLDRLSDGIKLMGTNATVGGAVAGVAVVAGVSTLAIIGSSGPEDVQAEPRVVTPTDIASAPPTESAPNRAPSAQPSLSAERLPQSRTAATPGSARPTSEQSPLAASDDSTEGAAAVAVPAPTSDAAPAGEPEPAGANAEAPAARDAEAPPADERQDGEPPAAPPPDSSGNDDPSGDTPGGGPGRGGNDNGGGNPGRGDDDTPAPAPQADLSLTLVAGRSTPGVTWMQLVPNAAGDYGEVRLVITSNRLVHIDIESKPGWSCPEKGKQLRSGQIECTGIGSAVGTLQLKVTGNEKVSGFRASIATTGNEADADRSNNTVSWP